MACPRAPFEQGATHTFKQPLSMKVYAISFGSGPDFDPF